MSFAAAFLALAPILASAAAQAQPAVPLAPPTPAPVSPVNPAPPALSIAPQILGPADVALYRQIMAAERAGQRSRAKTLATQVSDPVLLPYAQALSFLSGSGAASDLADWLRADRETAIADRVYRPRAWAAAPAAMKTRNSRNRRRPRTPENR